MHTGRCLLRPEGVRFPGVGVAGGCEPLDTELGTELRSSGRAASTLTTEPSHLFSHNV